MKIVNNFNNAYLKGFLERYAEIIQEFPDGKYDVYKMGSSEDHDAFKYSLIDDNAPFGTSNDRIAINETQCERLGLEDGEKDACLFHEIGHILHPNEDDGLKKELTADSLAVEIGLEDQLVSALKKMVVSDVFNIEASNEMMNRIEHWSNNMRNN